MLLEYYKDNFPIQLPVAKGSEFWNGRMDEFNNIGYGLYYSQRYGLTPFAKTGAYGYNPDVTPKIHNGHDIAGVINTPLVAPTRVFVTYVGQNLNDPKGADPRGYGNFVFFETESITINGDVIKMEFVLAHCKEVIAKAHKWYNAGELLAYMGNTGFSTGVHTHFAGRPYVNGAKFLPNNDALGYIDLTDFFINKPIEDKQLLINELMLLVKKKGSSDIYAIDPMGKANLILNWDSFQKGLEMHLWVDVIDEVQELPELGNIIILTPNN